MQLIIQGEKNLSFQKRALLSHMIYVSRRSFRASEAKAAGLKEELRMTEEMLKAVEMKLQQITNEQDQEPHLLGATG
jgi:hypothetical protein